MTERSDGLGWGSSPPDLDEPPPLTDADAPEWDSEPQPPDPGDVSGVVELRAHPRAAVSPPPPEVIDRKLREAFRLEGFREGQREIIDAVLGGASALAVMPTGSGKSLCYQLPALLLPGITLVVSPLIALMKDQVDALIALGLPATFINSSLSAAEQTRRLAQIVSGDIKLVFVAPERFRSGLFTRTLNQVQVSLLAVDEAHCISEWGHDFRPDYRELGRIRVALGQPPTLALTATATPRVRRDIKVQLGIADSDTYISGFERKNLFLEVYKAKGKRDKIARLEALLGHIGGTSLVYCTTRKGVIEVHDTLEDDGLSVGMYHGGMGDAARVAAQDAFMTGSIRVLVATNAFGMGVDKSDIRSIIHFQMPSTLEAYYQEAGRAGRDGAPSHCLFLYNYADRRVPDFFIDCAHPTRALVEQVWDLACEQGRGPVTFDAKSWARRLPGRVPDSAVSASLVLLAKAGHLELFGSASGGRLEVRDSRRDPLRVSWSELKDRREHEEGKLNQVVFYATAKRCRTRSLLRYFGSKIPFEGGCGHCDLCVEVAPYASAAAPRRRPAKRSSARGRQEDPTLLCRKITAAIARCKQAESKHVVARMLAGSATGEVRNKGLDKLSTFGLLAKMRPGEVEGLIDVLIKHGLASNDGVRVGLTPAGVRVMKGEESISRAVVVALGGAPRARAKSSGGNTVETTLSLARRELSVDEIAAHRSLTSQTIVKHLLLAAVDGRAEGIDLERYTEPEVLDAVRSVAETADWRQGQAAFREAVNAKLETGASYKSVRLSIAYLLQQGELKDQPNTN